MRETFAVLYMFAESKYFAKRILSESFGHPFLKNGPVYIK